MEIIYSVISFFACLVGTVTGIGGGVMIKPALDFVGHDSISAINLFSGVTVFATCLWVAVGGVIKRERVIKANTMVPLGIGSAIGGVLGKMLFNYLLETYDARLLLRVQSFALAGLLFATLVYTVVRKNIRALHVKNPVICVVIGAVLGVMAGFLGIGGGPINMAVLFFFFGMETKEAATNSIFIIVFSQAASILYMVIARLVPAFSWLVLGLMIVCGIVGAVAGRIISKKMSQRFVHYALLITTFAIVAVSLYNGIVI